MKTNLQFMIVIALLGYEMCSYGNVYENTNSVNGFSKNKTILVEEPVITVKGNLIAIANGDTTPSAIDNTVFPAAQVVGDAKSVTYMISNDGISSFDILSVQVSGTHSGDFSVVSMPSTTLLSGGQTFFTIAFNPINVGLRSAVVEVVLDSPSNLVYTFTVQGIGESFDECSYAVTNEVIVQQNFESSGAFPVWNYSITSGSASVSGGTAYAENGSPASLVDAFADATSLQVKNATTVVSFNPVNTSNLKDLTFTASLGSYATDTSNGNDDSDSVTVAVSTNGGLSWSDELQVKGSTNAKWSLFNGEALASSTCTNTGVAEVFAPLGSDYRVEDGYATVVLEGLPSVTDLRIRLTIVNDDAEEMWVIDDVTLTGKPQVSTTWNGTSWSLGTPNSSKKVVIDGDYDTTISGNIEANSVQVNSGAELTVTPSHFVNSQTDVMNFGSLTIEDGGALNQVDDYAVNTGNITYKRNTQPIRRYDFTYWSSPVGNQTLFDLSPTTLSDKYYSFNPQTGNWVIQPYGTSTMEAGKGYIVRAPNNFDLSVPAIFSTNFYGTINNGVVSVPISLQNGQTFGWNLIGNPYPSAIKVDDFLSLSENEPLFDQTVYLWTHNSELNSSNGYQYTTDDYAIYNFTGGVSAKAAYGVGQSSLTEIAPSGYIATGQSFFIKAKASGTAVFNNSVRDISYNAEFYKNSITTASPQMNIEKNRVWLDIRNGQGAFKQTLVGYVTGATDGIDSKYDGVNLNGNSYMNFYSINAASKLSIQGRALPFTYTDRVELGYYSAMAGTYKISINHLDGVFENQNIYIYLEDKVLDLVYDLKASSYSFTTASGTFDNRFVLRYSNSALTNNQVAVTDDAIKVATQSNKIIVQSLDNAIQEIAVHNILGQEIFTQTAINQTVFEINKINKSNQVYFLTIRCADGTEVFKKIMF